MPQYLGDPAGDQLGPLALTALGLLVLLCVASVWWARWDGNNLLHRQVRRRLGSSIAVWCVAESAVILWRTLGFEDPRLIPYGGMLLGMLLLGYAAWYLSYRAPIDQRTYTSLKDRIEHGPVPAALRVERSENRGTMGLAELMTIVGAGVFYFAMFPSTDHALHWVALAIGGAWGYSVGLVSSAGRGVTTLAWRAAERKKPQHRQRTARKSRRESR